MPNFAPQLREKWAQFVVLCGGRLESLAIMTKHGVDFYHSPEHPKPVHVDIRVDMEGWLLSAMSLSC
jgi:hypothetical protein